MSSDDASKRFNRIIKEQTRGFLANSTQIKLQDVGFRATKGQAEPGAEAPPPPPRASSGGIPQDIPPAMPDPLLPRRDMAKDSEFKIVWLLTIEPPAKPGSGATR